jgi:hypothetical protein
MIYTHTHMTVISITCLGVFVILNFIVSIESNSTYIYMDVILLLMMNVEKKINKAIPSAYLHKDYLFFVYIPCLYIRVFFIFFLIYFSSVSFFKKICIRWQQGFLFCFVFHLSFIFIIIRQGLFFFSSSSSFVSLYRFIARRTTSSEMCALCSLTIF